MNPSFAFIYAVVYAIVYAAVISAPVSVSAPALVPSPVLMRKLVVRDSTAAEPPVDNSSTLFVGPSTQVAMIILYVITGTVTCLFLIIIVTGAIRAARHPDRYGPRANSAHGPPQTRARGIARAVLDTFPTVIFRSNTTTIPESKSEKPETEMEQVFSVTDSRLQGPNAECPICIDAFEAGSELRILPCKHQFHAACIDPWLLKVSSLCPLCRLNVDQSEQESSSETPELPLPDSVNSRHRHIFDKYIAIMRPHQRLNNPGEVDTSAIDSLRRHSTFNRHSRILGNHSLNNTTEPHLPQVPQVPAAVV